MVRAYFLRTLFGESGLLFCLQQAAKKGLLKIMASCLAAAALVFCALRYAREPYLCEVVVLVRRNAPHCIICTLQCSGFYFAAFPCPC